MQNFDSNINRNLITRLDFQTRLSACHLNSFRISNTEQKMKFSIKDFFSKYDQIGRKLRISSHLLKKPLMENFIFCAVR